MKTMLRSSLLAFLAATILGCGGGGGGDETSNENGGPAPITRRFEFPNFNNNSKLTVIANFQPQSETPDDTGAVSVNLSDLAGVTPRALVESIPLARLQLNTAPCGYADACALNHLMGDVNSRSTTAGTVRARFQELAEGSEQDFFLVPGFTTVTGKKILEPNETQHCTIFAEVVNSVPVIDRARALAVAEAFDSNNPQRPGSGIYDQVRALFGSEWNQNPAGGNDGDAKIVLFFYSSQTLGSGFFGYTSPADANPNGGGLSNKGEIIYVNADKDLYQQLATIAHEFQHLINQNEKLNQQGLNPAGAQDENISLNEGLSGLAEEVCGFTFESGNQLLAAIANDYLEKPGDHEFFDFFEAGRGYGQGYLFFKYVREHFGDQVIRDIAANPGTGLENLDRHLPPGFNETFRRWTVANYATNLSGNVPSIYRYPSGFRTDGSYKAGNLVGVRTRSLANNNENSSGAIKPWSVRYLTFDGASGGGLEAEVTGIAGSPFGVVFESLEDTFTSFGQ
jgi:hypothetical protein